MFTGGTIWIFDPWATFHHTCGTGPPASRAVLGGTSVKPPPAGPGRDHAMPPSRLHQAKQEPLLMGEIHFAPPKNWTDDSPVNTNEQRCPMVSKWCEMDFATIHSKHLANINGEVPGLGPAQAWAPRPDLEAGRGCEAPRPNQGSSETA